MSPIILALFLTAATPSISDASTLFSPQTDIMEQDRIQVIDQAIITTTEGLVYEDGVRL